MQQLLNAYLQIIYEGSSTTDYTPNQFVEKIYQDIKSQDLTKDFVLQYDINTFKKYVHKDNFKYYNQFMKKFQGKDSSNFSIIILNYAIFNNNKIKEFLQKHKAEWNIIKTNVRNQKIDKNTKKYKIKNALQKYKNIIKKYYSQLYKYASNKQEGFKLLDQLKSQYSISKLHNTIEEFYNGKPAETNNNKEITSNQLFKDELNNYVRNIRNAATSQNNLTNGFCLNFNDKELKYDGFLFFINKNIILQKKNPLPQIYYLINHQVDHYFEMTINGTDEEKYKSQEECVDKADVDQITNSKQKLIKDTKWIKYLFQRSEFNSRCTDLCNILLNEIVPVSEQNAVDDFTSNIIQFSKNNNWNKIVNCKWYSENIDTEIVFASLTYQIFPKKYWPILVKRLNTELETYLKMSSTQKNNYKKQLQKKFNKTYPKTDSFLQQCSKSKNLFKTLIYKAKCLFK